MKNYHFKKNVFHSSLKQNNLLKNMSICLHCAPKQINRNCIQEKDDDVRKGREERRKKSLILFSTRVESLPVVFVPVQRVLKDKVAKPNNILREAWLSC